MAGETQFVLAVVIFVGAYALIATERLHRTVVALAGAALMLALRMVPQEVAFARVDWNTIFLLFGMMVIVGISSRTGMFQWLAIRTAKLARGEPMRMIVMFSVITAVLSAFLDNVTTVLLIAPVTILIAEALSVSPVPFLISEILACNIGGTATLIGDPPNIMVGSAAGMGFVSFIVHLTPVVVIVFVALLVTLRWFFRASLTISPEARARIFEFDERKAITDRPLLRHCLLAFGLTLLGFCIHEWLHLAPATIALAGAALLLLITRPDLEDVLHEVEWPTLLFFIGLFIMVAGLNETGVIGVASAPLLALAQRSIPAATLALLWVAGIVSGVIGSIPFTAAAIPMLMEVARGLAGPGGDVATIIHGPQMLPLWWALALGACLGGNATLVASIANVVVAGVAERNGYRIRFAEYLKYSIPVVIESLIISSAYIYLRYLL